jgi:hypothetical protein
MTRVIMACVGCVVVAAAAIGTWRFLVLYTAQLATSPEWRSRTPAWPPRHLSRSYGLMIRQRCR